jgi:hypothetical protein
MPTDRVILGCTVALLSFSAAAQPPGAGAGPGPGMSPPLQGKVQSLQGSTLTLTGADGKTVTVMLPPDVRIESRVNKTMADLKAGQFVGSTSVLGADGQRHATEVHIMSAAARGMGEGHRPMGNNPQQTMTNGNIDGVVNGKQGEALTISYRGGQQNIIVAPDTPVVAMESVGKDQLKAGTQVSVMMAKDASGKDVVRDVMLGTLNVR